MARTEFATAPEILAGLDDFAHRVKLAFWRRVKDRARLFAKKPHHMNRVWLGAAFDSPAQLLMRAALGGASMDDCYAATLLARTLRRAERREAWDAEARRSQVERLEAIPEVDPLTAACAQMAARAEMAVAREIKRKAREFIEYPRQADRIVPGFSGASPVDAIAMVRAHPVARRAAWVAIMDTRSLLIVARLRRRVMRRAVAEAA